MSEHPQPVLIVEKKDDLLILTLNRSDNANALNPELVEALLHEIDKAVDIRLCVIRGNGRHFCAGLICLILNNAVTAMFSGEFYA